MCTLKRNYCILKLDSAVMSADYTYSLLVISAIAITLHSYFSRAVNIYLPAAARIQLTRI